MKRLRIACVLVAALITTSEAHEADRAGVPDINRYCITEIDRSLTQVTDMNERGHVVGLGYVEETPQVILWNKRRGAEVIEGLASAEEFPGNYHFGLNDRGQIIGTRRTGPDGSVLRAFVWTRGKALRLLEPASGDGHSVGIGINNRGRAIGTSGPFPDEAAIVYSVVWSRHFGVHRIGLPDGAGSLPVDINEVGQVVGVYGTPGGVSGYVWDWNSGVRTVGGLPEGDGSSSPAAINDSGEVVGSSSFGTGQHAMFWSESSGAVDLGDLPGGPELSHAHDLNNRGQIVGNATGEGSGQAVLWDVHRKIHILNDLVVRSGPDEQFLHMFSARHITDAGWINVVGFDTRDRERRNFLLTPARPHSPHNFHGTCSKGRGQDPVR